VPSSISCLLPCLLLSKSSWLNEEL